MSRVVASARRYFDASFNKLSGVLSPKLKNLVALTYLNVKGNKFAGKVPKDLSSLIALQYVRPPFKFGPTTSVHGRVLILAPPLIHCPVCPLCVWPRDSQGG